MPPEELERRYAISCEDAIEFIADSRIPYAIVDRDFIFVWCNRAYCDVLSLPLERIIGHKFTEFTHPDDIQGDVKRAEDVVTGKIRSYWLPKRYLRWGNIGDTDVRREIFGDLHVQGVYDDTGEFKKFRVQFMPYLDTSNRPQKPLVVPAKEVVQWVLNNWKLAAVVATILTVTIFGSSENLLTLIREFTGVGSSSVTQQPPLSPGPSTPP